MLSDIKLLIIDIIMVMPCSAERLCLIIMTMKGCFAIAYKGTVNSPQCQSISHLVKLMYALSSRVRSKLFKALMKCLAYVDHELVGLTGQAGSSDVGSVGCNQEI